MKRYGDGPARREMHFTKKKERVDRELPAGQKSPSVAYAAPHASVFTAECVNVNLGKTLINGDRNWLKGFPFRHELVKQDGFRVTER